MTILSTATEEKNLPTDFICRESVLTHVPLLLMSCLFLPQQRGISITVEVPSGPHNNCNNEVVLMKDKSVHFCTGSCRIFATDSVRRPFLIWKIRVSSTIALATRTNQKCIAAEDFFINQI